MLTTTILFAALLAADTATTSDPPDLAKARADVTIAANLQRDCFSPRECSVARELMTAAREALEASQALHAVKVQSVDPWQTDTYTDPFEDLDTVPEAIEAKAAFDLAGLQNTIDQLAQ
jgi:hypothetical protein